MSRSQARREQYLRCSEIIPQLPDTHYRRSELPDGLIGATIINVGSLDKASIVEGGGLVIEYRAAHSKQNSRVVLGFNEIGMWIEGLFPVSDLRTHEV